MRSTLSKFQVSTPALLATVTALRVRAPEFVYLIDENVHLYQCLPIAPHPLSYHSTLYECDFLKKMLDSTYK